MGKKKHEFEDKLSVGYTKVRTEFLKIERPDAKYKRLSDAWEKYKRLEQAAWKEYMEFDYAEHLQNYNDELQKLRPHINSDYDNMDFTNLNFSI